MAYQPVFVSPETRERVHKLAKAAGFPYSAVVGLAVHLLGDDIDKLRKMLEDYQKATVTKLSPRSVRVSQTDACPQCGEDRVDPLLADTETEYPNTLVKCQTCGHKYKIEGGAE